jgi:small neutral amino acid transporter SnatA (MarC family)
MKLATSFFTALLYWLLAYISFAIANTLDKVALGRTDISAASTFYTVHNMILFKP